MALPRALIGLDASRASYKHAREHAQKLKFGKYDGDEQSFQNFPHHVLDLLDEKAVNVEDITAF